MENIKSRRLGVRSPGVRFLGMPCQFAGRKSGPVSGYQTSFFVCVFVCFLYILRKCLVPGSGPGFRPALQLVMLVSERLL